jgi:CRP/FNR family cyclic AMP-dependent transcriptional regulator
MSARRLPNLPWPGTGDDGLRSPTAGKTDQTRGGNSCPAAAGLLACHNFVKTGPAMKHDTSFEILTGNTIDVQSFKAGSVIFREGDEAHELFVVKSGEIRIQIGNRTISELSADSIFGEMALIDNEPRSATAIAVTDVELIPVSEKQFLFLVSQTPYFALKVMRVLAQRLRATNKTFA